jgi:hypothetical protein
MVAPGTCQDAVTVVEIVIAQFLAPMMLLDRIKWLVRSGDADHAPDVGVVGTGASCSRRLHSAAWALRAGSDATGPLGQDLAGWKQTEGGQQKNATMRQQAVKESHAIVLSDSHQDRRQWFPKR